MYADDLKIWRTVSPGDDNSRLQADLDQVTIWLNRHHLTPNPDKCACLHINQRGVLHSYNIGGTPICPSVRERDLGSLISSNLSQTSNTNKLTKGAWNRFGVLTRLTGRLESHYFPAVFKSLVHPLLETNIQAVGLSP